MSDFGDMEEEDMADPSEPDPEVLARWFIIERRVEFADDDDEPADLDDLDPVEKAVLVNVFRRIIDRLRPEWRPG